MNRWQRNRRTLLVSPAATLLLSPFIKAARAMAEGVSTPRCLLLMSKPQGMYPHNKPDLWVPKGEGAAMTLPTALSPFEPIKSSLNFLCGYDLKAMRTGMKKNDGKDDAVDWHHGGAVLFNGGMLPNSNKVDDYVAAPTAESIDWFVAKRWNTRPLNLAPFFVPADTAFKNGDVVSWKKEANGQLTKSDYTYSLTDAWNEVFKGLSPMPMGSPAVDTVGIARTKFSKSILDGTRGEVQTLKKILSSDQTSLLDAHENALRELEMRLSTPQDPPANATCEKPAANSPGPFSHSQADTMRRISDSQAFLLAVMRCGLRPVLGFHLGPMTDHISPGLWPNGKKLHSQGSVQHT